MRKILLAAVVALLPLGAAAQLPEGFTTGPVFEEFGPVADMDYSVAIPKNIKIKHAFDISKAAEDETKVNRAFESAARFINMHARG